MQRGGQSLQNTKSGEKGHHSSHESFDYSNEVPVLLIDVISRFIKHMCKQLIFFFI